VGTAISAGLLPPLVNAGMLISYSFVYAPVQREVSWLYKVIKLLFICIHYDVFIHTCLNYLSYIYTYICTGWLIWNGQLLSTLLLLTRGDDCDLRESRVLAEGYRPALPTGGRRGLQRYSHTSRPYREAQGDWTRCKFFSTVILYVSLMLSDI